MRRLRGKSRDSNSETKFRTEVRELRSSDMTKISDSGHSDTIRALASSAALRLLAGRTSLAPRLAKTRAVSAPIPDVAPSQSQKPKSDSHSSSHTYLYILVFDWTVMIDYLWWWLWWSSDHHSFRWLARPWTLSRSHSHRLSRLGTSRSQAFLFFFFNWVSLAAASFFVMVGILE